MVELAPMPVPSFIVLTEGAIDVAESVRAF